MQKTNANKKDKEKEQNSVHLDALEQYLQELDVRNNNEPPNSRTIEEQLVDLNKELCVYEKMKREPAQTKVLNFWELNKEKFPILSGIALLVQSVSPTEVSVERLFSAFAFILSPSRTALSDKHLDDILLIRENDDLSDFINEQELKKFINNPMNIK